MTAQNCYHCDRTLSCCTAITAKQSLPEAGDIFLCAHCGATGQFDIELKVKPLSADDVDKLPSEIRQTLTKALLLTVFSQAWR